MSRSTARPGSEPQCLARARLANAKELATDVPRVGVDGVEGYIDPCRRGCTERFVADAPGRDATENRGPLLP